ncbi:MAG TPA: cyclic nucleotide-binding domain-containing protein [Sphingobacteriaceae bacterium]
MDKDLFNLRTRVSSISQLSDEEWQVFQGRWESIAVPRKRMITDKGQTEKYLYFITAGLQRVYYQDERNREATIVFTYPNSFGGVLDSMLSETPSRYFYESLTKSAFLRITYASLKALMDQYPGIQRMVTTALSGTISGLLERQVELQCFSSEEKFRIMFQRSPHILNMIPHKYIASYLGIDATNFSKLLNRVKI